MIDKHFYSGSTPSIKDGEDVLAVVYPFTDECDVALYKSIAWEKYLIRTHGIDGAVRTYATNLTSTHAYAVLCGLQGDGRKVPDVVLEYLQAKRLASLMTGLSDSSEWEDDMHPPADIVDSIGWRFERIVDYAFGGLHHVRHYKVEKGMARFLVYQDMSTFDSDLLTRLVIASHQYGVRAEIHPCNFHYLEVYLHPRAQREGATYARHPSPFELIERIVALATGNGWRRNI